MFRQANNLLLRKERRRDGSDPSRYFHPKLDLMGDMHELPGLLAVVGFRFDDTIETQNNATMDEGKRSWFPRDKRLLSNRMIDVLCEYLLLDYYLFDFRPLERCRGRIELDVASIEGAARPVGAG